MNVNYNAILVYNNCTKGISSVYIFYNFFIEICTLFVFAADEQQIVTF